MDTRRAEADAYYAEVQKDLTDADARLVQRQALAGMIWSKQYFYYDVPEWLNGDPQQPPPPSGRAHGRNFEWKHLNNADIISMPDKWEYPWYAAWDLAFHTVAIALIDTEFAKSQLLLMTREWYMHPNGQLPAYEWAFGDVNPPVHAWATWRVFQMDRERRKERGDSGAGDLAFLERVFHKLMLNFTWWVNRKDAQGRNIFQGGFLGLDNIGVFDRSAPLPTGGFINQADGTSWMAMYSLNLMRIALELARHNPVYEDIATKFFEHFLHIAEAMNNIGESGIGLWDEQDEFYYDVLNLPDGRMVPLKVRSMVGLIPLYAVEVLEPESLEQAPRIRPAPQMVPQLPAGSRKACFTMGGARPRRAPSAFAASRAPDEMPAPPDARRDGVSLRIRRARQSRKPTKRIPTSSAVAEMKWALAISPLNRAPGFSAETRTGADRSGCLLITCSSNRSRSSTNTTVTISRSSARPAPENT